ncbi:MAG: hypothetical protein WAT89_01415, partial [Candidatus Kapaibacterium sp.]
HWVIATLIDFKIWEHFLINWTLIIFEWAGENLFSSLLILIKLKDTKLELELLKKLKNKFILKIYYYQLIKNLINI